MTFVRWGEGKVKLSWNGNTPLPSIDFVTSVHGFCFYEGGLLLVKLNERGWDFPGGHLEKGELPQEAFQREAMEEGYVRGSCQPIGSITVDHRENPNWNKTSPYPEVGYQLFYRMNVKEVLAFDAAYESNNRMFVEPKTIADYDIEWNEVYQEMLEAALKLEEN